MHQRAGPVIHVPPPVQPTVTGRYGGRRSQPATSTAVPGGGKISSAVPEARAAEQVGYADGSDLDISDSLPRDSPALNGRGPAGRLVERRASPPPQPVYASVVKKKKKKPSSASPPRIAAKPSRTIAGQPRGDTMAEAPRSPARIPLIRISQTESVEQAEKNATTPITDDSSAQVFLENNKPLAAHQCVPILHFCMARDMLSSGIFSLAAHYWLAWH